MDLDRLTESVLLPGGGHSRVHSLLVASRGLVLLGLGDGWVKVISMEDGSHVCQMNVQDPENLDVTPGHVSHICHVTRDTRDHVTVVTSGGLLCSWVMGHQPEPVFCIRQGMSHHSVLSHHLITGWITWSPSSHSGRSTQPSSARVTQAW